VPVQWCGQGIPCPAPLPKNLLSVAVTLKAAGSVLILASVSFETIGIGSDAVLVGLGAGIHSRAPRKFQYPPRSRG
jgi:hypothetical protein